MQTWLFYRGGRGAVNVFCVAAAQLLTAEVAENGHAQFAEKIGEPTTGQLSSVLIAFVPAAERVVQSDAN